MPANAPPDDPKRQQPKDRPEVKKLTRLLAKKHLSLQDYFAAGEQLHRLDQDQKFAVHGSKWRKEVAKILGCSQAKLNKCLQFHQAYQEGGLADLQQIGIGWGWITNALGIEDTQERHKLLRQAKDQGWSEQELQREVQRLKGSHRGGGRPRRKARSWGCLPDLVELARLAKPVNEFLATIWLPSQEIYTRELAKMNEQTQQNVRQQLDNATNQLKGLQGLQKQCKESLLALKALLGQMPVPGQK